MFKNDISFWHYELGTDNVARGVKSENFDICWSKKLLFLLIL